MTTRRMPLLGALTAAALAFAPGAAHAATVYSPLDETMLQASIQGDRFEIAGGRIAAARAVTPAVGSLGARLVKDHSKSLREAVALARRLGIAVPATPTTSEEWELAAVSAMSGPEFDAAYAYLEIQDHKMDIEDSRNELDHGLNHSVRHMAHEDLPVLRMHLRLSEQALWKIPGRWPPER